MDSVQHFEKKSEHPSNIIFEKQHRLVFYKKKKGIKRSKLRLKKPNFDDKIRLVNELSTNTAKVCALCFSASDKMGSSSSDFFLRQDAGDSSRDILDFGKKYRFFDFSHSNQYKYPRTK